ncbi:hypothetical protein D3C73_1567690 [compost metagenome]
MRLIIILVFRFSRIERRGRQNLRHNLTLETLAGLQCSLGGFRLGPLFFAVHEDRSLVRAAPVHELAAPVGRIDQLPVDIQ